MHRTMLGQYYVQNFYFEELATGWKKMDSGKKWILVTYAYTIQNTKLNQPENLGFIARIHLISTVLIDLGTGVQRNR